MTESELNGKNKKELIKIALDLEHEHFLDHQHQEREWETVNKIKIDINKLKIINSFLVDILLGKLPNNG